MAERGAAGSLRARLLLRLAILLTPLLLFSGWSAYWNGRAAADTAYDRTLLASARAIADGLVSNEGKLRANVPYVALDTFAYDSAGRIYYQVLDTEGQLVSDTRALGQLVEQITLTLLFSLDYQRILGNEGESRLVVYQVMMLVAPHLAGPSRYAAEQLAQRYLEA